MLKSYFPTATVVLSEQQLELDLRPPFFWTTCAHCDEPVHRDDVIIKQYYTGTMTLVEHFCCDEHHHAWYINRLRSFGL